MDLDVQNRVPIWPMGRHVPRGGDAQLEEHTPRGDYACHNQEGGPSGSRDVPAPSAQAEAAPGDPEEDADAEAPEVRGLPERENLEPTLQEEG